MLHQLHLLDGLVNFLEMFLDRFGVLLLQLLGQFGMFLDEFALLLGLTLRRWCRRRSWRGRLLVQSLMDARIDRGVSSGDRMLRLGDGRKRDWYHKRSDQRESHDRNGTALGGARRLAAAKNTTHAAQQITVGSRQGNTR